MRPRLRSHPFRELSRFVRDVRPELALNGVLLFVRTASELVGVFLLSPLITDLSRLGATENPAVSFFAWFSGEDPTSARVRWIVAAMALSQAVLVLTIFARPVLEARLSTGIMRSLRNALYDHLQHLAFSFYDRIPGGRLTGRLLKDLDTVGHFLKQSLLLSAEITVSMTAYLLLLFSRSHYLLFAVLAVIPVWYALLVVFNKRSRTIYQAQDAAYEDMIATFNESVHGKHVIRAFGTEARERQKFHAHATTLLERTKTTVAFHARFSPLFGGVAMVSHLTLFAVCAYLIRTGRLPVGDLVILGAAMSTILSRLEQISQLFGLYPGALAASRRLFEILHVATTNVGAEPLREAGDVRFEDVTFSYVPEQTILKNLSATFPKGQVTALIGPTSSGKTTLTLLLARFYDPTSGRIFIGEQAIDQIALKDLRHHVGFVFQETFLFTASIRDNIRFGRTDVSEEMLERAAVNAHAHEFIVNLPQGYDTPIGDKGVQLSGGQRQRLALARALVYDPPILILDDATAALDASTDRVVRKNLREAFAGRTVIMITHKPTSLELADRVLVLAEGRAVEASGDVVTKLAEDWA